jgi:DNA polymerase elongation subunit (family B)
MRETFKKIIGFDTETLEYNKKQNFYSFQVFCPELDLNIYCDKPTELVNLFTASTQGCYLIMANAEFDISVIQQVLKDTNLKINMVYSKSKLLRATIKDQSRHTWHIIDIFNLFPRHNVAKLGELLNLSKLEKPDYLGKRKPQPSERKYFIKYAMRDAEIAYHTAKMLIDEFGKIKSTLPSLAMSHFRKENRNMEFWKKPIESLHEKIKISYRGGRTEAFNRGTLYENVYAYDVRSLYPSIMANCEFPNINLEGIVKSDVNLDYEGVALCTIKQDLNIPPLAIKHKDIKLFPDGHHRLVFPNGIIRSWFTYPELRYLELHGYGKIIKVHEAIEYKRHFNPFKKWVTSMFDKRAEYLKQGSSKAEMFKLMLNALYGKFAQNLTSDIMEFQDNKLIKQSEQGGISRNTHFALASYITAQGRLQLHRYMMNNKGEDILYCDTDGFFATKKNYNTKDILGGLTERFDNKPIQLTTIIKSKLYVIDDTVKFKGLFVKMSGNQLRLDIINDNLNYSKDIILKPRMATRMHLDPLTTWNKKVSFSMKPDNKRVFKKDLHAETLITDFTGSEPIELRNYV